MAKLLRGLSQPVLRWSGEVFLRRGTPTGLDKQLLEVLGDLYPDEVIDEPSAMEKLRQLSSSLVPTSYGWLLADTLANARSTDPVRAFVVVLKLAGEKDSAVLDDSDIVLIQEAVKNTPSLNNNAYYQISTFLEGAEEAGPTEGSIEDVAKRRSRKQMPPQKV